VSVDSNLDTPLDSQQNILENKALEQHKNMDAIGLLSGTFQTQTQVLSDTRLGMDDTDINVGVLQGFGFGGETQGVMGFLSGKFETQAGGEQEEIDISGKVTSDMNADVDADTDVDADISRNGSEIPADKDDIKSRTAAELNERFKEPFKSISAGISTEIEDEYSAGSNSRSNSRKDDTDDDSTVEVNEQELDIQNLIYEDNDTSSEDESPPTLPTQVPNQPKFIMTEAEVEDDEFQNYGGVDGEDLDMPDSYDKKLINDKSQNINLDAILQLHHDELVSRDAKEVTALINDVTSGLMRKRKTADEKGLDLDDSDEENKDILRMIRKQMGLGNKRKQEELSGLTALAMDIKTRKFAECFIHTLDRSGFLDSEEEEEIQIDGNAKIKVKVIYIN
jgi:hypothetical protein